MNSSQHLTTRLVLVIGLLTPANTLAQASGPDSDHDGVPDIRDRCPATAQTAPVPAVFKYRQALSAQRLDTASRAWPVDEFGCEPDSDGDGHIDSRDYCPNDSPEAISAGVSSNGCPHQSDADGTPDWRDHCPGTHRGVPTDLFGCPTTGGLSKTDNIHDH